LLYRKGRTAKPANSLWPTSSRRKKSLTFSKEKKGGLLPKVSLTPKEGSASSTGEKPSFREEKKERGPSRAFGKGGLAIEERALHLQQREGGKRAPVDTHGTMGSALQPNMFAVYRGDLCPVAGQGRREKEESFRSPYEKRGPPPACAIQKKSPSCPSAEFQKKGRGAWPESLPYRSQEKGTASAISLRRGTDEGFEFGDGKKGWRWSNQDQHFRLRVAGTMALRLSSRTTRRKRWHVGLTRGERKNQMASEFEIGRVREERSAPPEGGKGKKKPSRLYVSLGKGIVGDLPDYSSSKDDGRYVATKGGRVLHKRGGNSNGCLCEGKGKHGVVSRAQPGGEKGGGSPGPIRGGKKEKEPHGGPLGGPPPAGRKGPKSQKKNHKKKKRRATPMTTTCQKKGVMAQLGPPAERKRVDGAIR